MRLRRDDSLVVCTLYCGGRERVGGLQTRCFGVHCLPRTAKAVFPTAEANSNATPIPSPGRLSAEYFGNVCCNFATTRLIVDCSVVGCTYACDCTKHYGAPRASGRAIEAYACSRCITLFGSRCPFELISFYCGCC